MRIAYTHMFVVAALLPTASNAAESLKYGSPPDWVATSAIPAPAKSDAPIAMLLNDQQIRFEPGKIITYTEAAMRIQNPQGLAAGNISFNWNPATDTVTVNKLQIRRGDRVIDVLGSGQTFTILRRESNLEAAMLDGTLTANIQPEGLQEGDVIVFATTAEHSDPVLKGHGEAIVAAWNGLPISSARTRLSWPAALKMSYRRSVGLPEPKRSQRGDTVLLEIAADDVQPMVPPKGAPDRFGLGRFAEVTDFRSWSEIAQLFAPLYRQASALPKSGPLHDELNQIRASTADPKARAEKALALVQDRVRYVALVMGQGGYVPAPAQTTWSRRFGDCKAKTALLLGFLHELGIEAEPVLVNSSVGDAVGDRLPMVQLFNHVLVRAHIGDKSYWLDGTRTSDTSLDRIEVPDFGWALPLVRNASLIQLIPPPLSAPNQERSVTIDASDGIYAPATATISQIYRGDSAVILNSGYSTLSATQREELIRNEAHKYFDGLKVTSSSLTFDKQKRELTISATGTAKLNWQDGWFFVPTSTISFNPDFERPAGPFQEAPVAVGHPRYVKDIAAIRLPTGVAAQQKLDPPVRETLAGVEYSRTMSANGDVVTVESSERSIVPEVPYKDAVATEARLRALHKDNVYLKSPHNYRPSERDRTAIISDNPATAEAYNLQGYVLLEQGRNEEAIAKFTQALSLDPKNHWALANRGIARVRKTEFAAADKDLSAAEAIEPKSVMVFRGRAIMAEAKDDPKTALAAYTAALALDPSDGYSLVQRAHLKKRLGDDDGALADSEAALGKVPQAMDLRVMRANILLKQGKPQEVAKEAKLLIDQNPLSDYAFVAAGKIYAKIGMRDEAFKAYDRALAIKPQAYIYINRAESRPYSDKAGKIADLGAALKLDPSNPDVLADQAELLAKSGDFKRALELYGRAASGAPDNSKLRIMWATALYRAGRKVEAEAAFSALRKAAVSATDYNSLCWNKATTGILLDSALADCREALHRKPGAANILDSLGFVLLRLGRLDESIDAYNKAIAKQSGSASYMGRALAYARKGDTAHAQSDRVEALKLDPDAEGRFEEYGLKF